MKLHLSFLACVVVCPLFAADIHFPDDAGYVDVTKPPYNAVADGKTDCTAAIQTALLEARRVYLPAGTYLVSDIIHWGLKEGDAKRRMLQGADRDKVIIKLKDNCPGYDQTARPKEVLRMASRGDLEGPANAFRSAIYNLTIDTGKGNPAAVGVLFYVHNQGSMEHVRIIGDGLVGVDMYRGLTGPALLKDITVEGFEYGMRAGGTVRQMTLDDIHLKGQRRYGIYNDNNILSIEDLTSDNSVPAVHNRAAWGFVSLVDAKLTGGASGNAAIENINGEIFVRNLKTAGYSTAIISRDQKVTGPDVAEFTSRDPVRLLPATDRTLNLPKEETPDIPYESPDKWVNVQKFGGKPATFTSGRGDERPYMDFSDALQAAIDSGATTIYLPPLIQPPKEHVPAPVKATGYAYNKAFSSALAKALPKDTTKERGAEIGRAFTGPFGRALEKEVGPPPVKDIPADVLVALVTGSATNYAKQVAASPDKAAELCIQAAKELAPAVKAELAKDQPPYVAPTRYQQYGFSKTVIIRGNVRRLFMGDQGLQYHMPVGQPAFRFEDGKADVVVMERFERSYTGHEAPIEIDTKRTVVLKNAIAGEINVKAGKLFLEDVCGGPLHIGKGATVHARQFNPEPRTTMIVNDGGTARIMGMKTEKNPGIYQLKNGSRTEVLGGLIYANSGYKSEPMITVSNAQASLVIVSCNHNALTFETTIRETRGDQTVELPYFEGWRRDGWGTFLPLYSAVPDPAGKVSRPDVTNKTLFADLKIVETPLPPRPTDKAGNPLPPQFPEDPDEVENTDEEKPAKSSEELREEKRARGKAKADAIRPFRRPQSERWDIQPNLVVGEIMAASRQNIITDVPKELVGADFIRPNLDSYKDPAATNGPCISFRVTKDADLYLTKPQNIPAPEGWTATPMKLEYVFTYNGPHIPSNKKTNAWAEVMLTKDTLFTKSAKAGETVSLPAGAKIIIGKAK